LFSSPSNQPAAAFTLVDCGDRSVVFENKQHDFPQRVIYRRESDQLIARIEGTIGGVERRLEWRWNRTTNNDHQK
jgi:hypothetical protein